MVIGSQYLIPIEIEATGFSMDSNPWNVRCNVGAMSARCNTTKIDGAWYWFSSSGALKVNGWVGNYYVGSDGAMLTSTVTPDGYRVGSDGSWDGGKK